MGLSITGTVGTVYAIQATTNAAQTNGWTCLAFIQLPTANYLWLDSSAPAAGRRFYRAVTTAPKNLVFIPPGTFRMGSPTNEVGRFVNEGPQTEVTLTKGFYMGKYEVTQGDYLAVIGSDPSYFTGDTNRPVETVTWSDATNYCAQRSQQELAAGRIPAGSQYRLPTEAEWEYAGRAWTSTRFYHGDDLGDTNLTNYAWHGNNSDGITQAVGQKLPNAWGLYDMAGNVWEWCQDRYGPYPGGRVTDPQGPGAGLFSVVRGGSWISFAGDCRSAGRFSLNPAFADFDFGFRVVLAPGP
jgi:formylglycine-generating enzyme required for sulfatase activity